MRALAIAAVVASAGLAAGGAAVAAGPDGPRLAPVVDAAPAPARPAAGAAPGGAAVAEEEAVAVPRTGGEMYSAWCATCHGPTGRADGESTPTLANQPHDFTDCRIIGGEADYNVFRTIKEGGAAVGLSDTMPAYGEALTDDQIHALVDHLRSFCADQPRWVRSSLSFPRWFEGDKAFPENEVVLTPSRQRDGTWGLELAADLRPWAATAVEVEIPFREKRAVVGLKHALWFDEDLKAIATVALAADVGETPFFAVPKLIAGWQIGPAVLQASTGVRIPFATAGAPADLQTFAAVAVHAPAFRPYAPTLAPGVALRFDGGGGTHVWTVAPQLYWRWSEIWSSAFGAVVPLDGSGDWSVTAFLSYEFLYPF